jgi:hypothetical protein
VILDVLKSYDEETAMSDPHDRWIKRLRMTWPQGVAARQAEEGEKPTSGEPWPDTWRDPEGGCDAMSSLPALRRAFG